MRTCTSASYSSTSPFRKLAFLCSFSWPDFLRVLIMYFMCLSSPPIHFFSTVVLKKTLESPLDCKDIKPVNPKGNLSWMFFGRTDAKAKASKLWSPDAKNWLIRKDPDAGKDGWMPSLTQWTWTWTNSRKWLRTGNREPRRADVHGVPKSETRPYSNSNSLFTFFKCKYAMN